MLTVRPATSEDFERSSGFAVPEAYCIGGEVVGYVAERGDSIVAMGFVTWDLYGRAWGQFYAAERPPAVMMHRYAKKMLAVLREVGEPALHAFCSQSIPGAATWLARLGFCPAPELTTDPEHPVWKCTISN